MRTILIASSLLLLVGCGGEVSSTVDAGDGSAACAKVPDPTGVCSPTDLWTGCAAPPSDACANASDLGSDAFCCTPPPRADLTALGCGPVPGTCSTSEQAYDCPLMWNNPPRCEGAASPSEGFWCCGP